LLILRAQRPDTSDHPFPREPDRAGNSFRRRYHPPDHLDQVARYHQRRRAKRRRGTKKKGCRTKRRRGTKKTRRRYHARAGVAVVVSAKVDTPKTLATWI